jgi:hypothetical protein
MNDTVPNYENKEGKKHNESRLSLIENSSQKKLKQKVHTKL